MTTSPTPENQPGEPTNEQKLINYAHNIFDGFVFNLRSLETDTPAQMRYKLDIIRRQAQNWLDAEQRTSEEGGDGR